MRSIFFAVLLLCIPTFVASTLIPIASVSEHRFNTSKAIPVGKKIKLGDNVLTYVSKPKHYAKDTAVLILTDVFGIVERNNLLLTDHFAAAGFQTYAPDYLFGDPIKGDPFDPSFNLTAWLENHSEARTTPALLSVIKDLKKQGIKKIAVSGYCFGGLYATRLAQNNTVTVSSMAHPSFLQIPEDFQLLKNVSKVPTQVLSAELDALLTPELAAQIDPVVVGYKPGFIRIHYTGVGHSFAVSANATDPVAVAAKEAAYQASLAWIKTNLGLTSGFY